LSPGRYAVDRAILQNDEVVGLCGLAVDRERDEGEAWYLLEPRVWGQGYGTEALRALLALGFDDLGLHRIWACCVPANVGSARVMEKNGMRLEGRCRQNLPIHGNWEDSLIYAILLAEFSQRRAL
jgi:RimJ/RimL family protein N-acetyltransferase